MTEFHMRNQYSARAIARPLGFLAYRSPPSQSRLPFITIDIADVGYVAAGCTCGQRARQKCWVNPASMVRRIPYCGAPTPTPVPLRI